MQSCNVFCHILKMFDHSVRVPRHYKVAANIVKKVSTEGGSVKTLLYDEKLRHFRVNVLYALITETIKHAADIDKLFESSGLITNEPRLDPWLAKVLTTELLFGKKTLPGKSKPEQTILSYKEKFENYNADHPEDPKTEAVRRPRYVRINTNLLTTSDAIRAFQDEEYRFVRCTSGSYNDYLEQIKNLGEYDFTQDYHVKTVFVFSSGTKLHEHELYTENKIILQDKATALAVHLLAPPPGSIALDMCAAPGMKTTQLAAYMRNEGKIYAVEQSEQRYRTLCDFVQKTGSKCVQTLNQDSLALKRGDYDDVEYILLDPSCSGSGMELSVHNYFDAARLAKLTSLQEKFLKHAMNAFPNAKRIVYSTCSLFPEENERVVTNVVTASRSKWRVQDVKELLKGQWNNFGSGMYGSMGTRCLYARPDTDYTTGFFLAVLDRDQKELERRANKEKEGTENGVNNENDSEAEEVNEKKHKKNKKADLANEDNSEIASNKVKKKKKKTVESLENSEQNNYNNECEITTNMENEDIPKKKKKRKHEKSENDQNNDNIVNESETTANVDNNEDVPKKKKKRKSEGDINYEENNGTVINESEITVNTDGNEDGIKKKKKKHKNREVDESVNVSEIMIETENTDKMPKKKKKGKHKDETNGAIEELEDGDVGEEVKEKKKKKKKDKVR
ncbi:28S rRNA (cytosine-C(5))-methyltransferase-like [Leguminivora glycinivorella]|uniref:28S rRNA (cytosine-C(5))-methyltransferase-like n=1 Tax=Leguminivora glycinivorella TaxID=1035111 RepID=UPI00200F8C96|nr:28S rRNA (cytosine-C(5))-methyltransferase-like [Leguminivora glycinivorella]